MEGVQRLVARSVEKMLDALAAVAVRGRMGEEVPTINLSLHLAQGVRLSGVLLDYLPREAILLASTRDGVLSRNETVTYVAFSSVVAVTVESPSVLNQVPFLVRPALSREDLLKHAERLARELAEQFWPSQSQLGGKPMSFEVDWVELDTEPGRRALEDALNVTAHALRLMGKEQNGLEGIRRISQVKFARGRQMAAALEGGIGKVSIDPSSPMPSAQAFRKGLSAGL
ncbi:hypothetical protein SAMN05444354_105114 [Stigmatella aurantiaca]|uniref:Uncharacterized protein n=1 Tax=Stigmatella aurantiaca TaxID=41 RepID=A0A1H7NY85_STIAU|nr:hypothetical protein [Stigmatella aurantiaca]SEL28560.1 hypothetical protein SAMN05444354_105114 [Stigmatella aurantiaca]